ncbi:MAG: ChaN family lipoprotein, partial [Lautropia sp.]|nr:ChaN family lipoprotein [Lautropia sp.]
MAPASRPGATHRAGDRHVIVFEHLDREHDPALQRTQRQQPDGPMSAWLESARFDGKTWGQAHYQPLFDAAFEATQMRGARWVAANFSRDSARAWMRAQMRGQGADAGIDPALLGVRQQARWDDAAAQA